MDEPKVVRPRNVDQKIVAPPGYTLMPDGFCYRDEEAIEREEAEP
jgi:hypothetical protein